MSRYTVVWDREFEAEFTLRWVESDSETRAILTRASDWIDDRLAADPLGLGRPVKNLPIRSVIVPGTGVRPATVYYQAMPDDRLIRILNIIVES